MLSSLIHFLCSARLSVCSPPPASLSPFVSATGRSVAQPAGGLAALLSPLLSPSLLCRRGHIVCPLFIFCICPDEDNLDDHFFHFLSLTCPLKSSPGDSFKDKNQLFDFILGNSLSQRTGEQAGPAYVRPSHQHSQENLSFVMSQETFAAGSFLALRPFSL